MNLDDAERLIVERLDGRHVTDVAVRVDDIVAAVSAPRF